MSSLTREASETLRGGTPLAPLGLRLEELERWYVLETLRRADGNRTKAARQLGISLRGLQYKLRRYGTSGGEPETESGRDSPGRSDALEPQQGGARGRFGAMSQLNDRPSASTNS